jgi:hypothetical protein
MLVVGQVELKVVGSWESLLSFLITFDHTTLELQPNPSLL